MSAICAIVSVMVLAGVPVLVLERRIERTRVALTLAIPAVLAFLAVQAWMPFAGIWSEAVVILAAAAAGVAAGVAVSKLARGVQGEKDSSGPRAVIKVSGAILLMFLLVVPILWSLLDRVRYAHDLAWDADGVVVTKDRSSNHNLPMLAVRDGRGRDTEFVGVDPDFWTRAGVGDRLRKVSGETSATLNGQSLEFVRARGASRAYPEEPPRR